MGNCQKSSCKHIPFINTHSHIFTNTQFIIIKLIELEMNNFSNVLAALQWSFVTVTGTYLSISKIMKKVFSSFIHLLMCM